MRIDVYEKLLGQFREQVEGNLEDLTKEFHELVVVQIWQRLGKTEEWQREHRDWGWHRYCDLEWTTYLYRQLFDLCKEGTITREEEAELIRYHKTGIIEWPPMLS